MAKGMRLKLNNKGFRELRNHPNVIADLERRANRIADAAGEGFEARAMEGRNRGRASVFTADFYGRRKQSKENVLQRALNAGRG